MSNADQYCFVYRHKSKLIASMLFISCAQLDDFIDYRILASIFLWPFIFQDKHSNHQRIQGEPFRSSALTNSIDDPALIILLISFSLSALFEFLNTVATRYNHPPAGIYLAYISFLLAAILLFMEWQNRWIRCSILVSARKIKKNFTVRLLRATLALLIGIALIGIGGKLLYETNVSGMLSFSLGTFMIFSATNLLRAIFISRRIKNMRKTPPPN